MFVLAALVQRWVNIQFAPIISKVKLDEGAYIDWSHLPQGAQGIKTALEQQQAGLALSEIKVTTLQNNLDNLIPGLAAVALTFLCMWLLKKKNQPNYHHSRSIRSWYSWSLNRASVKIS